jgi:hypothetical protein
MIRRAAIGLLLVLASCTLGRAPEVPQNALVATETFTPIPTVTVPPDVLTPPGTATPITIIEESSDEIAIQPAQPTPTGTPTPTAQPPTSTPSATITDTPPATSTGTATFTPTARVISRRQQPTSPAQNAPVTGGGSGGGLQSSLDFMGVSPPTLTAAARSQQSAFADSPTQVAPAPATQPVDQQPTFVPAAPGPYENPAVAAGCAQTTPPGFDDINYVDPIVLGMLGCPNAPDIMQVGGAHQPFSNGFMIWVGDGGLGTVYAGSGPGEGSLQIFNNTGSNLGGAFNSVSLPIGEATGPAEEYSMFISQFERGRLVFIPPLSEIYAVSRDGVWRSFKASYLLTPPEYQPR